MRDAEAALACRLTLIVICSGIQSQGQQVRHRQNKADRARSVTTLVYPCFRNRAGSREVSVAAGHRGILLSGYV